MLIEPVQGESGVNLIDFELLASIREACDAVGAALVFDEVQTGMGRTGSLWAYEQTGVVPDAMTLAKGLGGGLPIGALVIGERLQDVFAPGDHGSTFAGGPVVSSAALAPSGRDRRRGLPARRARAGRAAARRAARAPGVLSARGRGLMVACEVADGAPELGASAPCSSST